MRIRRLLAADSVVTPEAMARFQTDPTSERALAFLPILLGGRSDSGRVKAAAPDVKAARELLAEWDGAYRVDDRRAVLFEAVMNELGRRTWDELVDSADAGPSGSPRPAEMVLLTVAADSGSAWWDDRRTAAVERRDDILEAALAAGLDSVTRRHGGPGGDGWRWGAVHHANIFHLLRLPALSALDVEVGAGPSTLSPSSGRGTNGASWRMVVELGPTVRGFGIYPGGQSGNPASKHYRDLLPRWAAGALDTLAFPTDPAGLSPSQVEGRLTIRPPRNLR
jgi:penicillin amidase